MTKRIFYLFFCVGLWQLAFAIPPEIVVRRTYNVRAEFKSILPADTLSRTRSFFLGGTAVEGSYQFYVAKIDSTADTVWTRRYGMTDQLGVMIPWQHSDVLLAGYTSDDVSPDLRVRAVSDTGALLFIHSNGVDSLDEFSRVALQLADGYLIGSDISSEFAQDVSLASISLSGNVLWNRRYPDLFRLSNLIAGSTDFYLFGSADSVAGRASDFAYLLADSSGNQTSVRRYGSAAQEMAADALRRPSGNTLLVGSTQSALRDVWILSLNAAGDSVRSRYWRTPGDDIPTCIISAGDPDSGFVIGGYTVQDTVTRGFLARYSGQGDSLWSLFIEQERGVKVNDVLCDSTFRYHMAATLLTSTGPRGYYVMTDPDPASPGQLPPNHFNLLDPAPYDTVTNDTIFFDWEDAIDPDGDVVRYTLQVDSDTLFELPYRIFGPIFVSRYIWASDTDEVDLHWRVIASDQFNNIRVSDQQDWLFRRFLPDSTRPFHLATPDSGLALPHVSQLFAWQRALDPDRNDSIRYTVYFQTEDTTVRIQGLRDTFITVNFQDTLVFPRVSPVTWWVTARSYFDSMLVQSQETWRFITWSLAAAETPAVVYDFGISTVYPNPFNATAQIAYTLSAEGTVTLDVFDLLGRRVADLVATTQSAGPHTVIWNAAENASGIYIARLTAAEQTTATKLLLLK